MVADHWQRIFGGNCQEHDLTEAEKLCPCCAKPRIKIGEQTSEQLAYVPASMHVIVHVRPTYACLECLRNGEIGRTGSSGRPRRPWSRGCP